MNSFAQIKTELLQRLSPLDLEQIILFGSYASGSYTDHSDIDLYIVTRDDFIPQNFKEKMEIKIRVSDALKDLKKKYDLDLIVHTRKMNELFRERDSLFSREIFRKGISLYE